MSDWAAGARESGDGGAEEARFVRAAIAEGLFLMLYMCEFDARLMIASNAFLQQKPLGPSTSKSEEDTPEGILRIEHVAAAAGVHPARRSTGRTAAPRA